MTDNEIIKAYEWLKKCHNGKVKECGKCPLKPHYPYCENKLIDFLYDLINRQKAEIERLKNELELRPPLSASYLFKKAELDEMLLKAISAEEDFRTKIKAEAIKEYHAVVKQRLLDKGFYPAIVKCVIEEVAQEMVGDKE